MKTHQNDQTEGLKCISTRGDQNTRSKRNRIPHKEEENKTVEQAKAEGKTSAF